MLRTRLSPRRALLLAGAVALALLLAVGGFDAIVDPFGAVQLVNRVGFNHYKPAAETRVRLVKAAQLARVKPAAIVLGTSRSHIALRVSHPGWRASPGYNLAFDGATPEEMYAYLRDAEAFQPLQRVVLGLDTWEIGNRPSIVRPDFDPSLLYDPDFPLSGLRVLLANIRILLSINTFVASVRTIEEQGDDQGEWMAPDGQRLGNVFFHRPGENFEALGPARYFWAIDRREIGWEMPSRQPPSRRPVPASGQAPRAADFVRRIVDFCYDRKIDLRIYITPAHAHQLVISADLGEWPQIEQGKRDLVALLAREARLHRAAPFPLWDFSGFSPVTTEKVPAANSGREMRYYWDSSHFKQIVGDFVLDKLFGINHPDPPVPPGFGRRLNPKTIDAAVAEDAAGLAQYRRQAPVDVDRIDDMIGEARGGGAEAAVRTAEAR